MAGSKRTYIDEKTKRINIAFEVSLLEQITELSEKNGISPPEQVRRICRDYFGESDSVDGSAVAEDSTEFVTTHILKTTVLTSMYEEIKEQAVEGRRSVPDQTSYLLELGLDEYKAMALSHDEGKARAKMVKQQPFNRKASG